MSIIFSRSFAMPSRHTFSIPPIADFIRRYRKGESVDPFSGNSQLATYRNDLSLDSAAQWHMDAEEFCLSMYQAGTMVSLGLFDPPYSPRQISECYRGVGREVGMAGTQNGALYKRVRDALDRLIFPGGFVLSFGWNSQGMGIGRGYELLEVLLVAHGGAHNDTICIAERKCA